MGRKRSGPAWQVLAFGWADRTGAAGISKGPTFGPKAKGGVTGAMGQDRRAGLEGAGTTVSDVRRRNERLLLNLLRNEPFQPNADLSRASGLAPQTVSVIMSDLRRRGLVINGEARRGRRGLPARPNLLNPDAAYSFGIEVEWERLVVVLVDFTGAEVVHWQRPYVYPDPETLIEEIEAVRAELLTHLPEGGADRVVGIGLAMPDGIASHLERVLDEKAVGTAWRALDLAGKLAARTGFEPCGLNDGTAACLAEYVIGAGRDLNDFAHLFVSSYIGAGIVTSGQIFAGPTGNAANLGAMMAPAENGTTRPVHNIAGLTALDQKRIAAGAPPLSYDVDPRDWQGPMVGEWIEEAGPALALTIANSRAVIEYDTAIIGGSLPQPVLERLIARVEATLCDLPSIHVGWPTVKAGLSGPLAPALGAAMAPLNKLYFGPVVLMS